MSNFSICRPKCVSIVLMFCKERGPSTKLMAKPLRPNLPVRPILDGEEKDKYHAVDYCIKEMVVDIHPHPHPHIPVKISFTVWFLVCVNRNVVVYNYCHLFDINPSSTQVGCDQHFFFTFTKSTSQQIKHVTITTTNR